MAKIIFLNPNDPEQPASGVYRWFYSTNGGEVTIYVGRASPRQHDITAGCTLQRGVFEAQRSCITSNRGVLLDTDFIVGTALRYLKEKGYDCYWQHISNDPRCGKSGGESVGVVDLLAIRKDHGQPVGGIRRGDALQIILIQVKGGAAARPTPEDAARLRRVAKRHMAHVTNAAESAYQLRHEQL